MIIHKVVPYIQFAPSELGNSNVRGGHIAAT